MRGCLLRGAGEFFLAQRHFNFEAQLVELLFPFILSFSSNGYPKRRLRAELFGDRTPIHLAPEYGGEIHV